MNDQIFQTPLNRRSSAADFRQRARAALSNRWLLAIGVGLLVAILGGGSSGGSFNINFRDLDINDGSVKEFVQLFQEDIREALDYVMFSVIGRFFLITAAVTMVMSLAIGIFVGSPVAVGYARFNLDLIDGKQETGVGTLFQPFRTCYWKSIGVRVLVGAITTAVSLIAAIIPVGLLCLMAFAELNLVILALLGVITLLIGVAAVAVNCYITYQYSLCSYILAEYPTLGVVDVLRNSRILMKGNKWRYFCLELSFIGWLLLAVCCTCGLGAFVVSPYMNAATAAFYDEVSRRATAKEVEFPSVNPEDYFPQ